MYSIYMSDTNYGFVLLADRIRKYISCDCGKYKRIVEYNHTAINYKLRVLSFKSRCVVSPRILDAICESSEE